MIYLGLLIMSFFIIWKSADYFVDSSHSIALRLNISPMVIGATVVAFGTSAPELFVNVFAALDDQSNIIYGNILGSNLANTLLILGSASLLAPLFLKKAGFHQILFNLIFTALISTLLLFQLVNRFTGITVLIIFIVYYGLMVFGSKNDESDELDNNVNGRSLWLVLLMFIASLVGLIFAAKLLIFSLLQSAELLGLSTMFLSLFAVALGTSLPELISTIIFVKKGHKDMVIGNVFGSNLFNIMFVLPISWLVMPLQMPTPLSFELLLLVGLLVMLLLLAALFKCYNRFLGSFLLIIYFLYIFFIYIR